MKWRQWPWTVKGAALGAAFTILFVALYLPCQWAAPELFSRGGESAPFADLWCLPLELPLLPIQFALPSFLNDFSGVHLIFASIGLWTSVGFIIGLLTDNQRAQQKVVRSRSK